VKFDEAITAKA